MIFVNEKRLEVARQILEDSANFLKDTDHHLISGMILTTLEEVIREIRDIVERNELA